jgi:fructokinase
VTTGKVVEQDRFTGKSPAPLIFGEVLYDCFPDGTAVPGGAPFNVAWHLQGFGLAPLFVSRVGADELGARMLAAMRDWGMDTRGVQRDPDHPTGRVRVAIRAGEPHFDLLADQAYDFIAREAVSARLREGRYGLAYHGSLIARHAVARAALDEVRAAGLPLFVDVNLRDPWWRECWLGEALGRARWAKLNARELRVLSPDRQGEDEVAARGEALRRRHNLEVLVVTLGEAGALVLAEGERIEARPGPIDDLVDTVGAGDAFSAVAVMGLLEGWPLEILARRAVEFASAICRIRGATCCDRNLYRYYLRKWNE